MRLLLSCILSLSLLFAPQLATYATPTHQHPFFLQEISKHIDNQKVISIIKMDRLLSLIPIVMKGLGNRPQITQQVNKIHFFLNMTGINFQKGLVLIVETKKDPSQDYPISVSLWIQMQRSGVLSSLLSLLSPSTRKLIKIHSIPSKQQRYFMFRMRGKYPLILAAVETKNLLIFRTFELFTESSNWWQPVPKLTTFKDIIQKLDNYLKDTPHPLAKAKDFQRALPLLNHSQIGFFIRPAQGLKLAQKFLPSIAQPIIKKLLPFFGADYSGISFTMKKLSARETFEISNKQHPLFSLFGPVKFDDNATRYLPQQTFLYSQNTFKFHLLKSFLLKLTQKFSLPPNKLKMALDFIANFEHRFLVHTSLQLDDFLREFSGQFGTALILRNYKKPPLLTSNKGAVFFLSLRSPSSFRKNFSIFLNAFAKRKFFAYKRIPMNNSTLYQLQIPQNIYLLHRGHFLFISNDFTSLKVIDNQTLSTSLHSLFTKKPALKQALLNGANFSYFDARPLYPWFNAWTPNLKNRQQQQLLTIEKQVLARMNQFFFSTLHHQNKIFTQGEAWIYTPLLPLQPLPPHKTSPLFLKNEKTSILASAVFAIFATPLLSSPYIASPLTSLAAAVLVTKGKILQFFIRQKRVIKKRRYYQKKKYRYHK